MTFDKVREDMSYLYAKLSAREGKYTRNMNRYMNNGARREDIWQMNTAPLAYVNPAQGADGVQTQLNLCKSIPDTLVSKISQANVRPFMTPLNGNWEVRMACQEAQHFSDLWLDEQHAYPKSVMCFRDATVCDVGVMHIDPFSKSLQRIAPWEYFVDPSEYYHGAVTRAMYYRKYYPLAALIGDTDNVSLKKTFADDPHKKGKFAIYYDLYNGKAWRVFNGEQLEDAIDLKFEQYGGLYRRPFVEMFFTKPMRGFYSVSLVDDLYPIQRQVDELVRRMDQATRLGVISMLMVPDNSGIKASNIENGVRAYQYKNNPDGGKPEVITPPAMHPQYIELLKEYIGYAHDLSGVSQLSAQGEKPVGVDSGKALQTMEDIESDRFNTVLQQFTHFLVDTIRVAIDVFPEGDSILPADVGRAKMTWGELRKQRDLMSIQFSAANNLSKDPNEKRREIEFLIQNNVISPNDVARFYQQPDLEGAYTVARAASEYCDSIIYQAIKTGKTDYLESVDLQLLKAKCLAESNKMLAASDDAIYVDRLNALLAKVLKDIENVGSLMNPKADTPPPPSEPGKLVLDAGQIKAISDVASQVMSGALSAKSASAILSLAFPNSPQDLVALIIQGATEQAPPNTQTIGGQAA